MTDNTETPIWDYPEPTEHGEHDEEDECENDDQEYEDFLDEEWGRFE